MATDVGRVTGAALRAAKKEMRAVRKDWRKRPSGLSGAGGVVLGVGLVTVGRLAAPKGREAIGSLAQRFEQSPPEPVDEDREKFEGEDFDEQPEAEGEEDFDEERDEEFEDEPEAEGDEDFDEEDEPEAEGDEDFEDEDLEEDDEPAPRRWRTRARARSRA